MLIEQWNSLTPGSIVGTRTKRLLIGPTLGDSDRTGAKIFRLYREDQQPEQGYPTADFKVYEVVKRASPVIQVDMQIHAQEPQAFRNTVEAVKAEAGTAIERALRRSGEAYQLAWAPQDRTEQDPDLPEAMPGFWARAGRAWRILRGQER